jgi:hypothetical protein
LREFPESTLRDYVEGAVAGLERKSAAGRG